MNTGLFKTSWTSDLPRSRLTFKIVDFKY